jgi:hypothetical protein
MMFNSYQQILLNRVLLRMPAEISNQITGEDLEPMGVHDGDHFLHAQRSSLPLIEAAIEALRYPYNSIKKLRAHLSSRF